MTTAPFGEGGGFLRQRKDSDLFFDPLKFEFTFFLNICQNWKITLSSVFTAISEVYDENSMLQMLWELKIFAELQETLLFARGLILAEMIRIS